MLSRNLEKSLHRALACANERRHEYATLEHLLLSLTEDEDAVAVFRACGVELERLRREVLNYVDNELAHLVAAHSDDAKPTASFQRVLQRAAIHVQSSGREEVTSANVLVAMFAERESHAVYFLQEHNMTRFDAVNFITHGVAKPPGRSDTRRVQGTEEDNQGAGMRSPFRLGGQMPLVDETKIIAAILCGQIIVEDTETDPVKKVIDIYERILAELRSRGHGRPSKREFEHIRERALVDPLTGAFNRRYFDAHASTLAARCRAERNPVAVLMIDVDNLKQINDAHGHAAGDRVLKQVVDRATFALHLSDLLARTGGNKFVVVMPETDLDAALQIAERLRGRIGDTPVEGATVTVSIGVATSRPDEEEELDATLQRADAALYEAKTADGNRVIADGGG